MHIHCPLSSKSSSATPSSTRIPIHSVDREQFELWLLQSHASRNAGDLYRYARKYHTILWDPGEARVRDPGAIVLHENGRMHRHTICRSRQRVHPHKRLGRRQKLESIL